MVRMMTIGVCVFSLVLASLTSGSAQQPTPVGPQDKTVAEHAEKMRRNIEQKGVGHQVTIIRNDGMEFHGAISNFTDQDFKLAEIDMKQLVTFRYEDVKKIYGTFTQGHPLLGRNPKRNAIITVSALGFVITLLAVSLGHLD